MFVKKCPPPKKKGRIKAILMQSEYFTIFEKKTLKLQQLIQYITTINTKIEQNFLKFKITFAQILIKIFKNIYYS